MSIDIVFFFFSSRRRHTRSLRDWSSDVCSSDLHHPWTVVPRESGAGAEGAGGREGDANEKLRRLVHSRDSGSLDSRLAVGCPPRGNRLLQPAIWAAR